MSKEVRAKILVDSKTFYDVTSFQGNTITAVIPTTDKEIEFDLEEVQRFKIFSGKLHHENVRCIDTSFYENIKSIDWDMVEVDRSFDPEKVEAYLALLDEPHRSFVKEVIKKTVYVSFKEFKKALLQAFYLFQSKIKDEGFYILLDGQEVGLRHWLIGLLWPELSEMNVLGIITPEEHAFGKGPKHILLVSDIIYTGAHIEPMDHLLEATYPNQHDLIFHLVVPYINEAGKGLLEESYNRVEIRHYFYSCQTVSSLRSLINVDKYYSNEPLIPNHDHVVQYKDALQVLYKLLTSDPLLIYFDHRVDTIPTIYLEGIVPGKNMRYGNILKQLPSPYKVEEMAILYRCDQY